MPQPSLFSPSHFLLLAHLAPEPVHLAIVPLLRQSADVAVTRAAPAVALPCHLTTFPAYKASAAPLPSHPTLAPLSPSPFSFRRHPTSLPPCSFFFNPRATESTTFSSRRRSPSPWGSRAGARRRRPRAGAGAGHAGAERLHQGRHRLLPLRPLPLGHSSTQSSAPSSYFLGGRSTSSGLG